MLLVKRYRLVFILVTVLFVCGCSHKFFKSSKADTDVSQLKSAFLNPPDSARPGVYWYFMDGNLSAKGMTEDLESMKKAGIGYVVFLEVNVGVPRGTVDYLSEEWLDLFKHAVDECRRIGINMTLGIGPGWTGSGGPWVTPAQSMQHLVSSAINISAADDRNKKIFLPLPDPKNPYFGMSVFTPSLKKQWTDFYSDVAVLAFPTPSKNEKISGINEKALYYRAPFSSVYGVAPFISSLNDNDSGDAGKILKNEIIDISEKLQADGQLNWKVPPGNWTIMRFVSRNNGAVTRPAPVQGLGFESDKFDTAALNSHVDHYIGKIFEKIGIPKKTEMGGLKFLHMDSWEMGAQNWTGKFRQEFIKRRGYDPLPFYPVYSGNIVQSREISDRFLWDLRQTSQELILENHALQVKNYAHRHGLGLSIEPYDMNPSADLELGSIADIPMGEFWSKGYGYNTSFSTIEAASIAHIQGQPVVQAEAFTAEANEAWKQYPGSMKNQGDWAFANGINRFFYHTFQHKPLNDNLRPGMTMGPYGVHWDRKQTWWPMVSAYHRYISRCQFMLQQGKPVADILYLTPEGAPQVFLAPRSAMTGNDTIPDRRGYNFDGCSPGQLYKAEVKDNLIVFPGGASYKILVLPEIKTMTTALLEKIRTLVINGATVVGNPPSRSPGLSGYPLSDQKIVSNVTEMWGGLKPATGLQTRNFGNGKLVWGDKLDEKKNELYPVYDIVSKLLEEAGLPRDFESSAPVRYTHRKLTNIDIFFVANSTSESINAICKFRTSGRTAELWDPLTGQTRRLPEMKINNETATIPLQFEALQSFFIVFTNNISSATINDKNFPAEKIITTVKGPWEISFDKSWGGPGKVIFDQLIDWTTSPENGIKYYSGIATYNRNFDFQFPHGFNKDQKIYLDLGKVKNIAHVWLNGHDLGVLWTAPWKVDITGIIRKEGNMLEIEVANLWPNRLIGDQQFPDDGIKDKKWPEWLLEGKPRTSRRFTFTTYNPYKKDSPLLESGLMGPVTIVQIEF